MTLYRGGLIVTPDGGGSWSWVDFDDWEHLASKVTFIDDTHGWVVSYPNVWRTSDGAQWERLAPPVLDR